MKDTTPAIRTFAFSPTTSRRVARALTIAVAACVGVLLSVRAGLATDVKFMSVGQGIFDVAGTITGTGELIPPGYAGTLNVAFGPDYLPPLTEAYCIDIAKLIQIGDVEPEVDPTYSCQVVYILNNFYPNAASVLPSDKREAAAVQAAIWFFTDDFVATAPLDVASRASEIVEAAKLVADNDIICASVVPQSIAVTPATAVNFFPDYSHKVTATLIGSDGQRLANYPVTIDVTGASGSQSFAGRTDDLGKFAVTYLNPGTAGTDTITAKASFNRLLGLQFEKLDTQPIVLAGEPDTGLVQGTANKTWKVLQDYHCYETHRGPLNLAGGVSLVDAFGPSTVGIKRAKRFCAPTDVTAAPVNPEHFTYYTLKQTSPKFAEVRDVTVTNQFGTLTVDLVKPDRLLVPTAKSLTGPPPPLATPLDHYKCYRVAGARFRRWDIELEDQFGTVIVDVKRPLHLCAPVNKNGEGVVDPDTFLMCYQTILAGRLNEHVNVFTQNQFGSDEFGIFGHRDLCVPSSVSYRREK